MSNPEDASFPVSERSRPQRAPRRVQFDRESIYAVIDAAPICHVGFAMNGQPFVIPTIHARRDDRLLFHGSSQSRLLLAIASGQQICVTFTFLDGIVAARSAMHHSMNYRSVVAFGTGRLIEAPDEKWEAYRLTVEKLLPGRWDHCRQPSPAEDKATAIAALDLHDASLKQRTGPPSDIEPDYSGPHWAGVLPLATRYAAPIPDDRLPTGAAIPDHISKLVASQSLAVG